MIECRMLNAAALHALVHSTAFNIQHCTFTFELHFHFPSHPPAKSRALQSANDMRILAHRLPHQLAAVVLDHRHDRTFVDAEVVDVEPALCGIDAAVLELLGRAQRRIEGVEEAVLRIEIRCRSASTSRASPGSQAPA